MRSLLIFIALAALSAFGCNRNKQVVSNADDVSGSSTTSNGNTSPSTPTTKVAEGAMKEILLSLKRVHFSYDGASLTDASKQALQEAAEKLREFSSVELYVDGHTDERGTTEYNMSLGDRRARSVVAYLKSCGVAPERLHTISFGEEAPLDARSDSVAFARNRRVDFRLMSGDVQFVLEEGDLVDDDGSSIRNAAMKSSDVGRRPG